MSSSIIFVLLSNKMKSSVHILWQKYLQPKLRFAGTSSVATAVDYGLFLILAYAGMQKAYANLISASCGFLTNFFLQKKYIFKLTRKIQATFLISLSFSIIGIVISTFFIHQLSRIYFFDTYPFITKLLVTGIMFFYNFYTKQIAFEKKINL